MAKYGMLRDYRFTESAEDIRGSSVYGVKDEKLGKIDDVIFDHSTGEIRYVVVDTGGWLSTKKFLVPADRMRPSAEHENDFKVDLTKEQVEGFPGYSESDLESDEKWSDYEGRYRSKWDDGPVMHRLGTDRNITPTTKQLDGSKAAGVGNTANWGQTSQSSDREPSSGTETGVSTSRIVPAGADTVVIGNSAAGISGRWDTFQSRLRERRKQGVGTGSATSMGTESADTLRKAV